MKYHLYIVILVIVCCACNSTKPTVLNSNNTSREQIRFGNGGGFTGEVTEYCLVNNGKLYKRQFHEIEALTANKKEIKQCFEKCTEIHFQDININTPSNTYVFIEYHQSDAVHRAAWNPHQPELPSELVSFHNMLLELIGEEPMTIVPQSKEVENPNTDELTQKEALRKIKPVKKKQSDKYQSLKQIDPPLKKKN